MVFSHLGVSIPSLGQHGNGFLGYHQNMDRSNRAHIPECQTLKTSIKIIIIITTTVITTTTALKKHHYEQGACVGIV